VVFFHARLSSSYLLLTDDVVVRHPTNRIAKLFGVPLGAIPWPFISNSDLDATARCDVQNRALPNLRALHGHSVVPESDLISGF
jgi:hypothetical protein